MLVGLLGCAFLAGGCDNSSSAPATGKAPVTPQNPSSIYGKSVKMAKDTRASVEQSSEQANQAANVLNNTGNFEEIAGLKWPIPAGWEKQKPSSAMRAAEYSLPGGISVRFFAIGGDTKSNFARWRGQVTNPIVREQTKTINAGNMKVQTIAMTGTYAAMGPGNTPLAPQEGTRFLGAIVEGGPMPVQVVLTGPWTAVEDYEKGWEMMLAGIQAK